jgi:hypothetical protein
MHWISPLGGGISCPLFEGGIHLALLRLERWWI